MARLMGLVGLVLLLALAGTSLAAPAAAPAPPSPADAEIAALLQGAAAALARKDINHLAALLADKAEVEVRGLNLDRRTVGRARVRQLYGPELASAESPTVEFRGVRVRAQGMGARLEAGLVAWVVPELPGGMGQWQQQVPVPGRLSAILEKQGQRWVFQRLLLVFPGGAR